MTLLRVVMLNLGSIASPSQIIGFYYHMEKMVENFWFTASVNINPILIESFHAKSWIEPVLHLDIFFFLFDQSTGHFLHLVP